MLDLKGLDDVDTCEQAFRLRRPEAPEMTRRRVAYWQGQGADGQPVVEKLKALLRRHNPRDWAPSPVDAGPTPEASRPLRRRLNHPAEALNDSGHLSDDHLKHAREIANIVRHLTAGSAIKTARYMVPSEYGDDDAKSAAERSASIADRGAWLGLLHRNVYRPWSQAMATNMPLILAFLVDEESVESLRRRHRMRWAAALKIITDGLDAYARVRSAYVRRGARPAPAPLPPRLAAKLQLRAASASAS